MNTFSKRLKTLRIENGLTQAELANVFAVTQTTLGKWELGQREPNIDTICKIAKYFQVTSDYLLGLED